MVHKNDFEIINSQKRALIIELIKKILEFQVAEISESIKLNLVDAYK